MPAQQDPLAGQLWPQNHGLPGSQIANSFPWLFTSARLMGSKSISCFFLELLPSAALRGKAVPAQTGQGNPCQHFPQGMLK